MLVTATHVQTVDLALLRLGRARLGADSVADIPMSKNNDVVERVRKAWRPLGDTSDSLLGGSFASSPDDFQVLLIDNN